MARTRGEIRVRHCWKDGSVTDTTAGHVVPGEIVQRIHELAMAIERRQAEEAGDRAGARAAAEEESIYG